MTATSHQSLLRNVALAAVFIGWMAADCHACRYSVRDVAFVAYPDEYYRLYVYVDSDVGAWQAALAGVNENLLVETNIRARQVEVKPESDDVALKHVEELGLSEFPAAVLVNREGAARQIPLEGSSPNESVEAVCRWASDSPRRSEVIEELLRAHSVILLVEGPDAEQNRLAREWATEMITLVDQSLSFLPKPMKAGPKLVSISVDEQSAEWLFLWSLDISPEERDHTHLVVLMGRGRKVGPVLTLPGAERVELERALAVVGQDCECGLDRRWMQGEMIPHVWSEPTEQRAVTELGFDPGSPSVATEISRILSRPPSELGTGDVDLSLSPLGLQIIELEPLTAAENVPAEPGPVTTIEPPAVAEARSVTTEPPEPFVPRESEVAAKPPADRSEPPADEPADDAPFRPILWTAIGLVCAAALGGTWILMKSGGNG